MMSLSHCSSTDVLSIGAAVFSGMEDKPNPIGAIKMLNKKNNDK